MNEVRPPARRSPRRRVASARSHSHERCEGHGEHLDRVNLTPGRRAILDMLCAAGKPLGAYEMIDLLVDADGRRPAPISVYRALDYLVEHGLVHRLASRNAFMACASHHHGADPVVFLICDACGRVREFASPSVRADLDAISAEAGFRRRSQMLELLGVCADCANAPHNHST